MKIIRQAARYAAARLGGPPQNVCGRCGLEFGAHVPGCPNER